MYDLRKAIQDLATQSQMWQSFCRTMASSLGQNAQTLESLAGEMTRTGLPLSGQTKQDMGRTVMRVAQNLRELERKAGAV